MAAVASEVRPLTTAERSLLDALLDPEFDGAAELRAQAQHARASTGCECGCVTIDLHVPDGLPVASAAGPAPVEGTVVDAGGEPIGGVLLFVEHGRLSGLEVYSFDDEDDRPTWWRRRRSRRR